MEFEEKKYRALLCRLYAEFEEEMSRAKHEADVSSERGHVEMVRMKREKAALYSASASKVRYACMQVGFDPKDGFAASAEVKEVKHE
jgi:citrate lyase synthetase